MDQPGLEPGTSALPRRRATRLRYRPKRREPANRTRCLLLPRQAGLPSPSFPKVGARPGTPVPPTVADVVHAIHCGDINNTNPPAVPEIAGVPLCTDARRHETPPAPGLRAGGVALRSLGPQGRHLPAQDSASSRRLSTVMANRPLSVCCRGDEFCHKVTGTPTSSLRLPIQRDGWPPGCQRHLRRFCSPRADRAPPTRAGSPCRRGAHRCARPTGVWSSRARSWWRT